MSYRSGTMVNPGEGSAWQAGAWVTTDPARIHTPEFLDEATFEAEVEAGGIVEGPEGEIMESASVDGESPPAILEVTTMGNEPRFLCTVCQRDDFKTRGGAERHLANQHGDDDDADASD